MINFNTFCLLICYFCCIKLIFGKTTEDVHNKSNGLSDKNFPSNENTLSPHPVSSPSSSPVKPNIDCKDSKASDISTCPSDTSCSSLGGECLNCVFNCSCVYGETVNVTCSPKVGVSCTGQTKFLRSMVCRYCYQTNSWEHECAGTASCPAVSSPRKMFKTNCSVKSEVICLGNRRFPKRILCNWTSGYHWWRAFILSITLGGFGADRFYLGHWQEGVGKLFSFGGLGVWTIIDVILIAVRYLGPADDSLYI